MEKVWRPFSVWERRPVTPLNGAISCCFRKKTSVFVNKCKTGNSVPYGAAAVWRTKFFGMSTEHKIFFKNKSLKTKTENWHILRLSPCKTAI
jgi:hypothetical protein